MGKQAIRTTFDGKSRLWRHQILMTSLKSVRKRRKQLYARDVRGLVAIRFCPLDKKVNKSCFPSIFNVQTVFTPISRPNKQAELLKIYFKPLVKKLKFSTLVP